MHLAQQATLETRDAKHEPRSLAEQRTTWLNEAATVLGGRGAVTAMVQTALAPSAETATITDARWAAQTADHILSVMEASRASWQMWHVRAEAQRQVRTTGVTTERASALVDLLVDEVLDRRCVALAVPHDGIEEPEVLRRVDGSSVYTVAGAALYTSQRILDAEARLVVAAGGRGGASVEQAAVELALLEMAANATALDAGQAALVRRMCTSGARLQLAIAPAGAGKTTAMRALTLAWTEDGGQVLGLAPSAAAAAVLAEETGIRSDTLAKLTWSLDHGELPDWAAAVGPSTLVIIDEAGMADTVSLDIAVRFVIARGGSVRLVGDDQQLAAVGAGGVLRDIQHTHGALRLTELHRFNDPAEAAASLTIREGDPSGLEFYLDHGRIHVGDVATTTEDAFNAWVSDRAAGLDAIMIAPTRNLVAELNARARAHRLNHTPAASEVSLADGNRASVGDVIITRTNDRRLRLTATDWVKNGDRWTITAIGRNGDLKVRHNRSRLTVCLPADYVQQLHRPRLRQHHPRRPRRHGRHHARPRNGARVTAAALHDAHPRPARQPSLPAGRQRRRPAHSHSPRDRRTPHPDRDPAGDPRPRRHTDLSHHAAAPTQWPSRAAVRGRSALHRRAPCRGRAAGWPTDRSGARRPSRPDRPRTHQRTIVADPQSTSARFGG